MTDDDAGDDVQRAGPTPAVGPAQRRWRTTAARFLAIAGPVLVAVAYLWFALHYIGAFRYQMNPDGVGYLSVAHQYATGRFADAVNAYWSPLYSWLLVPFLLVRVEPLLATKILGLLIGGATIYGMWRIARNAAVPRNVNLLICAAAIPLVADAAYQVTTPDLLVACAILHYLAALTDPSQPWRWTRALRIGMWAGIAYLAKAYALPFVIAHFLLVRLIELIRSGPASPRGAILRSSAISLLAFIVIVGAWSTVLTRKFGYVTTGSTGRYNLRIDAPNSPGQVMHFAGFLPPPNETAVSVWDDITYHVDLVPRWSPFESAENRQWMQRNVSRNFDALMKQIEWMTPWCYPILLLGGLLVLSRADLRPRRPGFILATAFLLYPCGYLVLHIERRFLAPVGLLMLLMVAYLIGRAAARGLLSGWWRRGIAAAVVGATFIGNPWDSLEKSRGTGRSTVELADRLRDTLPTGATVASDGRWGETLYLSYLRGWHYYGEPKPSQPDTAILDDLDRLNVDYLLVWRKRHNWPAKYGWTELPMSPAVPFKVFRPPVATKPTSIPATQASAMVAE
ncbi:MAG TPA: hypothetical protein VGN72_12655 [Tepidisphaeraceae bacterium]|nr:hypothetical protein [Tepidisphaeraceae bacterium]